LRAASREPSRLDPLHETIAFPVRAIGNERFAERDKRFEKGESQSRAMHEGIISVESNLNIAIETCGLSVQLHFKYDKLMAWNDQPFNDQLLYTGADCLKDIVNVCMCRATSYIAVRASL
jgi:hypothetical protein